MAADLEPPTPPSALTASLTRRQAALSWKASTDNVMVAGYEVWRSGMLIGKTDRTSYPDSSTGYQLANTYTIKAYDAAGNVSAESNQATTSPTTGNAKKPRR